MSTTWERIEPGWYTHPKLGGICRERDGKWWAWPLHGGKHGPYLTLRVAMQKAEKERHGE